MASATSSNLCATCSELAPEQKPKPGILLCTGCQKNFCSQHMIQHRQHLTDLLENQVVHERNTLEEKILTLNEEQCFSGIRMQLETIDKWEIDTIELIKLSAVSARKQLEERALIQFDTLKNQFHILSDELNKLRENENYFDKDIDHLTNKFQELKRDLEHFPMELNLYQLPQELITIKSTIQSRSSSPVSFTFVDQLIQLQKPKKSYDIPLSITGQMHLMSDHFISFYSRQAFPALNINNGSWQSLIPTATTGVVTELHWSDYLQKFLVLERNERANQPNKIHEFNPIYRSCQEIWPKGSVWNSGWRDNFQTLTCFKEYVLVVLDDKIEKWLATHKDWHTDTDSSIRWCPPISCQKRNCIKCIRMNDLYYALVIESLYSIVFELRNHGMSILHCIDTNFHKWSNEIQLFSLPDASGWLFFSLGENTEFCYVIDNDGRKYDQNFVVSSDIVDIAIKNNLIFLRKEQNEINDVLEIYEWSK